MDVQGDGDFAMIMEMGEKPGREVGQSLVIVLGCPFLFKSLLQVKTSKLGQRKCCEKVAHCGL